VLAEIVVAGGPMFFPLESTSQYSENSSGMCGTIFTEVSNSREKA
jgi:hypothetical protein